MPVENRPDALERLQSLAERALQDPASLEPREPLHVARAVVRLWHSPAFSTWTSWMVFEKRNNERALIVRRVSWDMAYDKRRFFDPLEGVRQGFFAPPTLAVGDAIITATALRPYLRAVRTSPIPVLTAQPYVMLDGETFGFQSYGSVSTVRLEWPYKGPKEWAPLIKAVERLRDFLDAQFREQP